MSADLSADLMAALQADLALAEITPGLLARAWDLHRLGFTPGNLRPSQMAAAGEKVRSAASREAAVSAVGEFLGSQLEKLRARAEREGRASSWLVRPAGAEEELESLGGALQRWIEAERYLPPDPPAGLDRLAALQRFWSFFHGFYRYRNETGASLSIPALEERPAEVLR